MGENTGRMETAPLLNHWRKEVSLFPFIKFLEVLNVPEWECFMTCHAIIKFYFKAISFLL